MWRLELKILVDNKRLQELQILLESFNMMNTLNVSLTVHHELTIQ